MTSIKIIHPPCRTGHNCHPRHSTHLQQIVSRMIQYIMMRSRTWPHHWRECTLHCRICRVANPSSLYLRMLLDLLNSNRTSSSTTHKQVGRHTRTGLVSLPYRLIIFNTRELSRHHTLLQTTTENRTCRMFSCSRELPLLLLLFVISCMMRLSLSVPSRASRVFGLPYTRTSRSVM